MKRNPGAVVGVALLLLIIVYPLLTLLVQLVLPRLFAVHMGLTPTLGPLLAAAGDPVNAEALANSLLVGIFGAATATVLGSVTALAHARARGGWRVFIDLSVWLVLFAPSYIIAQGWVMLMQDDGVAAQLLHLPNGWSAWFFTRLGLTLVMGLKYFPFVHIAMEQGIVNLGAEFGQAGRLSGGNPRQVLRRIILPLLAPAILAGFSIAFAEGFGDFGLAAAVTPDTHIPLVAYQIYVALSEAPVDFSAAAYLSLLLVVVTAAALWVQLWWTGRRSYETVTAQSRLPAAGGDARWVNLAAAAITVFAVLLPLGASTLVSLWRNWTAGVARGNWTLQNYVGQLHLGSDGLRALGVSLGYGLVAAAVTGALALYLGYQLCFRKSAVNRLVNLVTMGSLAIPGVVLAAGFIFAWSAPWMHAIHFVIYGTTACLALAYIAGALPYCIRLQLGAMSQLPPNLLTAARLFGAREWRVLVSVVLPLVGSTALSTFFLTFTHTIFELPASMMLYPPGMPTFSVRTEEQFSSFAWGAGSALTIIGMIVVLASYALGRHLSRAAERSGREARAWQLRSVT